MEKEGLEKQLRSGLVAGRNVLINGAFDIWQRGTSFTATGYTADRWRLDLGGAAATVSQQSFTLGETDVVDAPEYFIRLDVTNTAGTPLLAQRIEDVRTLAGECVTVSFDAKADVDATVTANLQQNFGTGGSPSSSVDRTLGEISVTDWWQRFSRTIKLDSIAGRTLGSGDDDYLELSISAPASTNVTIGLANIQVERGNRPSRFDKRLIGEELTLCERFYIELAKSGSAWPVSSADIVSNILFPTTMRTAPIVGVLDDTPLFNDYNSDFAGVASAIVTSDNTTSNGTIVRLDGFTGLTIDKPGFWKQTSPIWSFDAEL